MSYARKSLGGLVVIFALAGGVVTVPFASTALAQPPELFVRVGDTTAMPGETNTVISVYLSNFQDTVSGFNLYIQLNRPDIMEFQTDTATVVDTSYWKCLEWAGPVCIDSLLSNPLNYDFSHIDTKLVYIGSIETAGTICSDFALTDARSLSGSGFDLNIAGLAFTEDDTSTIGIFPQSGGLLIKILADVFDIPDTMTNRTVEMVIQYDVLDHFSFSRPDGSSIGIIHDTVPDSNCWVCTVWAIPGEVCATWERQSLPPLNDWANCDSIEPHLDTVPMVNTATVTLLDGSLTVLQPPPYICGDCDGLGDVNVADLTYMVAYLFGGGPEPIPLEAGNMDCVGTTPDVADLTYLVAYIFGGGPDPCEGC